MADAQRRQVPQIARTGHLAALGVGTLLLISLSPLLVDTLRRLLATGLRFDAKSLEPADAMMQQLVHQGLQMLLLVLPMGAAVLVAALAAGLLSGGWNFTLKPLMPKFSKLNPITGLPRLLQPTQLVETLKSCLLAGVLLVIGSLYLQRHWDDFTQLGAQPLPTALANAGELLRGGLILLLLALAVFALVDVPLQRWRLMQQLKMTQAEAKQEFKEVEGNVEMKARIKARMRQLANKRMLAAVPGADLVVMNPTHYAVALKYDETTMAAPRVVAKGTDLLALRIRDLAVEHKVPVLEAPPLARALYAHAEVDQEIPTVLFSAVAQVLAWVFQLRSSASLQAAGMPAPQPQVPPELDPLTGGHPARRRGRA